MNNTVSKDIILVNNLTGQLLSDGAILYSLPAVTITASVDNNDNNFDTVILWDFGDGTKINAKSVTHSYKVNGQYKITCTLFDVNGTAFNNTKSITVNVINPFESFIRYTDKFAQSFETNLVNIRAGEEFTAGDFYVYLSKEITSNVPILCYDSAENIDNSLNFYQHLLPTSGFYHNDSKCDSIMPVYNDVYISFFGNTLNFYIVNSSSLTSSDLSELSVINEMVGFNIIKKLITNISEITEDNYFYIGKIGKATVNYKSDIPISNNKLSFVLDQHYFPASGIINGESVNLISLAYSVDIGHNKPVDNLIFYSVNGLTTNNDLSKLGIKDNKYSIYRAKYTGVRSPIIFRIVSQENNKHFAKDFIIDSVDITTSNVAVDITHDNYYNNVGSHTIYISSDIEIDTFDLDGTITYHSSITKEPNSIDIKITGLNIINLNNFTNPTSKYYLDPKQKFENITGADIWKVYKTHDMFGNVPNLDHYITTILDNKDLMRTIINNGYNFVDDFGNINTSTVKALISSFSYLGITPDVFNIDNFARPNIFNKLMQIFSIAHSRLIGTEYTINDEFITPNGLPGKNLGRRLSEYDAVYVTNGWPYIVAYDKFAKQYIKINTMTAKDTPSMTIITDRYNKKFFTLNQYSKEWGWGLLAENINDLFQLYTLYEYKVDETKVRIGSFLAPETISDNIKDYDTWTKTDGSIDRLLYKTFIETLGLNKS